MNIHTTNTCLRYIVTITLGCTLGVNLYRYISARTMKHPPGIVVSIPAEMMNDLVYRKASEPRASKAARPTAAVSEGEDWVSF